MEPQSIDRVFWDAAQIASPGEREAYLDRACAGDGDLRRKVELLLQARPKAEGFLESPAANLVATAEEAAATERPGTLIGPYKLLQQIGEGGMGIVWMAEQTHSVQRKVALKVIKPGMDSRQVIARFEAERQALALMDHVNIARVFDAGATESGRPYFVMELVHGVPITQYCDDNRLTPRERLELFVPVCQALQHAHQKGIIHRDIKPSNVMITLYDGKPVPKVIDFGVAKATEQKLTERTLFTQYGTMVGTLEYMSPEQAEMSALGADTRSDIYSLGVLLYELLTGSTPLSRQRLREAAYGEVLRLIKEEEPPRPSTRLSDSGEALALISAQRHMEPDQLTRLVRGELDWIVMKALDKDRNRRYESAGAFAADVQRYLHDEPVLAFPPSPWYRLWKIARRHKGLVLAVSLVVLALVGGIIGTSWGLLRAERARRDAVLAQRAETEQRQFAQTNEQKALAAAEAERSLLYDRDMNMALQAWEAGDTARARDLLEGQRPQAGREDLRGFEWRYLQRLCRDGSRQTLRGHPGRVGGFAFSPDGKTLAANSRGGVQLWDVASQRHLKLLGQWSTGVAFAPDGAALAFALLGERAVRLWDVAGRCQRARLAHPSDVDAVAFSPNGKLLATGCADGTVRIWDAATQREVDTLRGHTDAVGHVVFAPDGRTLASAGAEGTLRLWDVGTGRATATLAGHTSYITSLSFSPDGKTLASAGNDSTVRLWDTATKQAVQTLRGQRTAVSSVTFSPDGKALATGGGDGTVRLWDAATKEVAILLRGHTAAVTAVAFAPDGRSLVSGSEDGTVKVWDVEARPDPNILAGRKGSLGSVAFSPDGKTLAVGDYQGKTVELWDLASRRQVALLDDHKEMARGGHGPHWCVTFAPDGQTLASASDPTTIRLWDVARKERVAEFQHDVIFSSAAFSPDGKLLAAGDVGGFVQVWDIGTGRKLAAHLTLGKKVRFSPDGTLLAGSAGNTVRLCDVATWQNLTLFRGRRAEILCLAFAPDGRTLAAGDAEGTLWLWDVVQQRLVANPRGHTARIASVAFSPDGRRLVTGGGDTTVKLWDVALLQVVATLTGHDAPIDTMAFSPDGNTLATASADATVRLWHAPPLVEALPAAVEASTAPPAETTRLFVLEQWGTAQATLATEGNVHRVDVAAVDGTGWHAKLVQLFDDFQEGATYTVRFRAKVEAPRHVTLYGTITEPDFHGIGLDQDVPLTEDWQAYQYAFQAKDLAALNRIELLFGERTGTVWIADFTVTKQAK